MKVLKLGKHTELRVQRSEYKGLPIIDIRKWYESSQETDYEDTYRPTPKGISLTPEQASWLLTALQSLREGGNLVP